ncbi:MAG: class I SAM-dependent methyltransferase [Labedaea sp.]
MSEESTSHTHDGIDWTTRLSAMRRADEIDADVHHAIAERVVGLVGAGATLVDIGPGAGGMSAMLATALIKAGGGRVVLVDAVPELLEAARSHVGLAVAGVPGIEVSAVQVDAASDALPDLVSGADLVWASRVVHHLPDQQQGIAGLVRVLAPGGWLALSEGGLGIRCLPWDVGVGEPGLADRLAAVHDAWFADMRAGMPGAVRMPYGWNTALANAGLVDVSSSTYLTDRPAPAPEVVRQSVADWLSWYAAMAGERLNQLDQIAVSRLLDPVDPAYVGARDDVFILRAATVHLGRKTAP